MYVIEVDEVICSTRRQEVGGGRDALHGALVRGVVELARQSRRLQAWRAVEALA